MDPFGRFSLPPPPTSSAPFTAPAPTGGVSLAPTSTLAGGSTLSHRMHISSSQIEKFQMCQRKWWLDKVAEMKEPYKRHFRYGHVLHEAGERFLRGELELFPDGWDEGLRPEERTWIQHLVKEAIRTGTWQVTPGSYLEYPVCLLVGPQLLDAGEMPLRARAVVKEGENGVRVVQEPTEMHDGTPLPAGALDLPYYVGFIDHFVPAEVGTAALKDHKTAKHRGYAKKVKDITESTQLLTYACIPFSMYPWMDAVEAAYNIFLKDDAAPEPVYVVKDLIHRHQSAARWQTVIQVAQMMTTLRRQVPRLGDRPRHKVMGDRVDRAANWKQVPGQISTRNPQIIKNSCDAYGGCPYRDMCFGRCTCEQLAYRLDKAA